MISTSQEEFFSHHKPLKEFLIENLKRNRFQMCFLILENLNIPDLPVVMGNYEAAIQHQYAGGSLENVENQLAKVRVFIQDQINKLA